MAMSKTTNTYNRKDWEDSDFPILCQTCLGDNPYLRMIKERFGKDCKVCSRPFTTFRWCPGSRMRFKKTEICQLCAKLKNVCQTCLLDLEYGLPTQVRDAVLKVDDYQQKTDVNKEYCQQNMDRELQDGDGTEIVPSHQRSAIQNDMLAKMARPLPHYKRNLPYVCTFWLKGECKRGEECPYRHEKPTDGDNPLTDQNIKDRYYGRNDPVADKIMKRAATMPSLDPPEDRNITTLYVGNLTEQITEPELRNQFYQFGEIRSISLVPPKQVAFVQFTKRKAAEIAAECTFNKLILHGRKLNIKWAHSMVKPQTVAKIGRLYTDAVPSQATYQTDFFNLREEVNILPAGMRLHDIPTEFLPSSIYADYVAPYSTGPSTSAAAAATTVQPSIDQAYYYNQNRSNSGK